MEIGGLVGDPGQEPDQVGMGPQLHGIGPQTLQFGIPQGGVNGAVADRMHRNGFTPASAPGYGMVALAAAADGPLAQPAAIRPYASPIGQPVHRPAKPFRKFSKFQPYKHAEPQWHGRTQACVAEQSRPGKSLK